MTLEEKNELINEEPVVRKTNMTDIFLLDIVSHDFRPYTDNEMIFMVISIFSIIGIFIFVIPFLCNSKIYDHLFWILKNNIFYLPLYIFLYIIGIFFHYICIPLYPFILMLKRI